MRVSLKWLKDYVDVPWEAEELAERLTMAGVAVGAVYRPGREVAGVVTGRIERVEPHPNADKLVVCRVDTGEGELRQIVTGAPNVREGQVVPVALEGARLAGGTVIKRARFRGVESCGMLCSGQELGLDPKTMPPEQAHGIMVLPPDTPLGADVRPLLGLDDTILELDLTPNRGDCLSMIGVAREVAALLGVPLRLPEVVEAAPGSSLEGRVKVDILDPELCRRYVALLFAGVKVGPSPLWMQERLRAAGMRPISNIVDITNYVMLEMGQPLHAFDYRALKDGHIIVRRAQPGEAIVTLDGVERHLDPEMLVIADPGGPVAIAGVMGGLHTEVTEKTAEVLLESAYFSPTSIRRTSRALGLRSEASLRFEKGIDLEGCLAAARRAAYLVARLGVGEVVPGAVDNYPLPRERRVVVLRPERVAQVLGVDVPPRETQELLERLGFEVQEGERQQLFVKVPSYRVDVSREIDLVEEVARIYGYQRIPATLPCGSTTKGFRTRRQELLRRTREVLAGCGLNEVITYSFISPASFDRLRLTPESPLRRALALQNPLSYEQSVMRTTLLPGILEVLVRNFNRRVTSGAIFELGRVFYPRDGEALPEERLLLAAGAMGQAAYGWNRQPVQLDFYFLKGIVEALAERLGLPALEYEREGQNPTFHPGRAARVVAGGKELGVLGEIHPDVLENYGLGARACAFELDLEAMLEMATREPRYQPLPRYPGVRRDIALVVPREVTCGEILRVIRASGGENLRQVQLFDVYEGQQIKQGYRSMAFSLFFQAADRTLTDEEVAARVEAISAAAARELGAELRR